MATADIHGIIVRWSVLSSDFWDSAESTRFSGAAQHWHSTACPALRFTPDGATLLSGGDESVLCLWHSPADRKPQFMPRIGGPIRHISVSKQLAAVSLVSNSIVLVDLNRKIVCGTLAGLPATLSPEARREVSAVGASLWVSASGFSAENFSPRDRRQTGQRILACERNFVGSAWGGKPNSWKIEKIAASPSTVVTALSRPSESQTILKFWDASTCQLISVCMQAHSTAVTSLIAAGPETFVSAGADGCVKTWKFQDNCWRVSRVLKFRDQPASGLAVSGSLLACGFGPYLTLWDIRSGLEISGGIYLGEGVTSLAISGEKIAALLSSDEIAAVDVRSCRLSARGAARGARSLVALPAGGFALAGPVGVVCVSVELEITSKAELGAVEALAVCSGELLVVTAAGSLLRVGGGRAWVAEEEAAAAEVKQPRISKAVKKVGVSAFPRVSQSSVSQVVASVVDPILPSHLGPNSGRIFAALASRLAVA